MKDGRKEAAKLGSWEATEFGLRPGGATPTPRWELGPGVVLLVAELCRGYRCGLRPGGAIGAYAPEGLRIDGFAFSLRNQTIATKWARSILLIFKNVFLTRAKIYTHSLFLAVIIAFLAVIAWEIFLLITLI